VLRCLCGDGGVGETEPGDGATLAVAQLQRGAEQRRLTRRDCQTETDAAPV
jgi:hypothetical protein